MDAGEVTRKGIMENFSEKQAIRKRGRPPVFDEEFVTRIGKQYVLYGGHDRADQISRISLSMRQTDPESENHHDAMDLAMENLEIEDPT